MFSEENFAMGQLLAFSHTRLRVNTQESAQISYRSVLPPSCPVSLRVGMPRQWTFVLFRPGSRSPRRGLVISYIRVPMLPLEMNLL